jgi:hypothetical protein
MLWRCGVFSSATMCSPWRCVLEQPCAVGRIGPGLGHHAGAVARADLLLVGLDQKVERGRIDIALFGQHGFQRAHAQLGFRELGMLVVVMVVVPGHGRTISKSLGLMPSSAP